MFSVEYVRARFAAMNKIQWRPEALEDPLFKDRAPADAAVLVPLVMRESGIQVLLTLRTAHLNDHAGQISFPGGRKEPHDETFIETALRETEEETGLARKHIEVLGTMPVYRTATNFMVTPVVGLVEAEFELQPDSFEVAEVFEVPLSFLMNADNHQQHALETPMGIRHVHSMPYTSPENGKQYFIWGATATMLRNLHHFLHAGDA